MARHRVRVSFPSRLIEGQGALPWPISSVWSWFRTCLTDTFYEQCSIYGRITRPAVIDRRQGVCTAGPPLRAMCLGHHTFDVGSDARYGKELIIVEDGHRSRGAAVLITTLVSVLIQENVVTQIALAGIELLDWTSAGRELATRIACIRSILKLVWLGYLRLMLWMILSTIKVMAIVPKTIATPTRIAGPWQLRIM